MMDAEVERDKLATKANRRRISEFRRLEIEESARNGE